MKRPAKSVASPMGDLILISLRFCLPVGLALGWLTARGVEPMRRDCALVAVFLATNLWFWADAGVVVAALSEAVFPVVGMGCDSASKRYQPWLYAGSDDFCLCAQCQSMGSPVSLEQERSKAGPHQPLELL